MPDLRSGSFVNMDIHEDFLRIRFHIKYKLSEIFFYSSEFVYLLPLPPRQLAKMSNGLLLAAKKADAPVCGLELHMVNDGQMALLNSRFMKRPGPTNVLSFPGGYDMPGSLVLSLRGLARESRLYGQDLQEYLCHLLCHGLAHLAGFEHGAEMDEFMEMLKREYPLSDNCAY